MTLPAGGGFDAIKQQLINIGAENVESFRTDPTSVLHLLVRVNIRDIFTLFQNAGRAYLYLVDEHTGTPLTGTACAPYPLEIAQKQIDSLLSMVLSYMYACILSARGISGGISGLVRLIFEAAYPRAPKSWAEAALGVSHTLDEKFFIKEVYMLHQALASMSSVKTSEMVNDHRIVRETCLKYDARGRFAAMQTSGMLWRLTMDNQRWSCRYQKFVWTI
jgi:hypothetical protein